MHKNKLQKNYVKTIKKNDFIKTDHDYLFVIS